MKLIIDIPEEYYNVIKAIPDNQCVVDTLIIKYGKPLPKGHGRLIDADKLNPDSDYEDGIFYAVSIGQIGGAETIVEAESEDKNDTTHERRTKSVP